MPGATGNIELITRYSPEILDEIFAQEAVTTVLEGNNALLRFVNAKTVMIPEYVIDGLGDYSRKDGFPDGDIDLTWTPYTLTKDRGRGFSIDAMDDEESAGLAFGRLQSEFTRTRVVPEVDAYRLSTLFANAISENVVTKKIAANTIIKEWNEAIKVFQDNEVPIQDMILFVSTEVDMLIKNTTELQRQITQTDYKSEQGITFKVRMYEDIPIIVVPKARFKTAYTFGANGFEPLVDALDMNYMFVYKNAALPVKKHEKIRVFAPDTYQKKDAWLFQYRLYHDIFTPKNKKLGIFVSVAPAV